MKEEVKTKYTFPWFYGQYVNLVPDKPVIIYGDREISWKEFDERSNQLANALLDLGVKREDKVLFGSYNSPYWFETFYAVNKIAATFTNLNYRFYEDELRYVIDNSDATAVFITEDIIERIEHIRPDLEKAKNYIVVGQKENTPADMLNYDELVEKYPKTEPKFDWTPMTEEDNGWFVYSGGTTGYPRAVASLKQILAVRFIADSFAPFIPRILERVSNGLPNELFYSLEKLLHIPFVGRAASTIFNSPFVLSLLKEASKYESEVGQLGRKLMSMLLFNPRIMRFISPGRVMVLATTPAMHAWGWGMSAFPPLYGCCEVVLTGKSYNPDEVLDLIERRKVNLLAVIGDAIVGPLVNALKKKHYDLSSLLAIINGGARVSADTKRSILNYAPNAIFIDTLMATDVGMMSTEIYTSADKDEEIYDGKFKAVSGTKIVDENFNVLKLGENGFVAIDMEILYKDSKDLNPELFSKILKDDWWYKRPDKSRETKVTIDGRIYNIPGDMGYMDKEGFIHFVGRGSECINTGGEKVYPEEVEILIKKNQKVNNVAITGVPDERWGEAVTAIVELKKGEKASEDEIIEFCRGNISGYKIPKHIIFVDELPLTSVYKPYYKKIKEIALEKYRK